MINAKKRLLDLLEFFSKQVEEDECTIDEMESIFRTVTREINARATVREMSEFFGQPEANVRNLISRKLIPGKDKPVRRVTYPLGRIMNIIPDSWKHNKH